MFEAIMVLVAWLAKWFESAKTKKQRRFGFYVLILAACMWCFYFVTTEQFWLMAYAIANFGFGVRGIYNNK